MASHRIARLKLPIALEQEMERIVQHAKGGGGGFSGDSEFGGGGGSSIVEEPPSGGGCPMGFKRAATTPETHRLHNHHLHQASRTKPKQHTSVTHSYTLHLSDQQKQNLRRSWQQVLAMEDGMQKFSQTFYPMFFAVNPAGQRLFQSKDMKHQSRVLMAMIGWVIKNLDDMHQLHPVIAQLGGRHEIYGVVVDDYKSFANSIARSLHKILGPTQFTDEMFKTWEACFLQMGKFMIRAAKEVRMGYRGKLMRQRANSSWAESWVSLTLDTIYVYNDEAFTHMRASYSLRSVEEISFPESTSAQLMAFELHSTDPPFTLQMASEFKDEFEEWVSEIDWRIRAIQRVYSSTGDSDSESDGDLALSPRKTIVKQTQKTKKRVAKKKAAPSKPVDIKKPIPLTEAQKTAIKTSWKLLCDKEFESKQGSEKGLARFYDEFYPRFFEINPVARRLFHDEEMLMQIRALVKMLSTIVKLIDAPDDLQQTMSRLGGRHEIYGVQSQDYAAFAKAMGDSLKAVLGKACTEEMKEAWFKIMMEISVVMQTAGRALKTTPLEGMLFRKAHRTEWKKSLIRLNLDALSIYRDTKVLKLKANIPLGDLSRVELMTDDDRPGTHPTPYGFTVETSLSCIYFCCETKEERARWMDELTWRMRAVARAYYTDPETSDSFEAPKKTKTLKRRLTQH